MSEIHAQWIGLKTQAAKSCFCFLESLLGSPMGCEASVVFSKFAFHKNWHLKACPFQGELTCCIYLGCSHQTWKPCCFSSLKDLRRHRCISVETAYWMNPHQSMYCRYWQAALVIYHTYSLLQFQTVNGRPLKDFAYGSASRRCLDYIVIWSDQMVRNRSIYFEWKPLCISCFVSSFQSRASLP